MNPKKKTIVGIVGKENIIKHDAELLDKVEHRIKEKMCSENCGERQCVDSMDRCVWYGYITEAITELKAEVNE